MSSAEEELAAPDRALWGTARDPANRRFIEAWLAWRGVNRLMPTRSAMEIADIRELLGSVALFEVLGPNDIRIKVAGGRLREHANFEATGRNFAEITPPDFWPIRSYRMMQMSSLPCAGRSINVDRRTLGEGIIFEIMTLPIDADAPGGARLLISCVVPLEGGFQTPKPDRQPVFLAAESFTFLDIGAGVPARTEP